MFHINYHYISIIHNLLQIFWFLCVSVLQDPNQNEAMDDAYRWNMIRCDCVYDLRDNRSDLVDAKCLVQADIAHDEVKNKVHHVIKESFKINLGLSEKKVI